MIFCIITHVIHTEQEGKYYAYAPYVREMNIWTKQANKVILLAPIIKSDTTPLDIAYEHQDIEFIAIDRFDILSLKAIFRTILKVPGISWQLYKAMQKADHIHLRCPGNIGLLGSLVQLFFPSKPKTAKYAGNWDPKSKQPWSYQLQQIILSNTFFTRNMQVLVYGQWKNTSKNITPFFTATYHEADKLPFAQNDLEGKINFVFVGTLVSGKNPLYAIQLVETLAQKGYEVTLKLYGEGTERTKLEHYIEKNELGQIISLEGNQTQETIKKAYQNSHFVILPSSSEGWPKAVAEAMFWGCVPIATPVSCVPWMLDYGNRGLLLEMNLEKDVLQAERLIQSQDFFDQMRGNASAWSRKFTMDVFEEEVKKLVKVGCLNETSIK